MYSIWTQHLKDPEQKDAFLDYLRHSRPIFDRLKDILKEKEYSLEATERTLDVYESPNWAYRQAHQNGYMSCLSKILNLINLDQQEHKNERNSTRPERTPIRPDKELFIRAGRGGEEVQGHGIPSEGESPV